MSLQDELDRIRAEILAGDPEIANGLEKGRQEIIAAYLESKALKPGDKVPDCHFRDKDLKEVNISDLLGDRHLVLSFYRGVWCPYCELELKALQAIIHEIEERGARLVAVSPELYKFTEEFAERHKLHYDLYTDLGNRAAKVFGLEFKLPEGLREALQLMNIDIADRNDECAWILPIPATFIISKEGVIAHSYVNADFTRRMEPADILVELDKLA